MSYQARTGAVFFAKNPDRVAAFYANVLDLTEQYRDGDHILLESPGFQLVVHRIMGGRPSTDVETPPVHRLSAAIKPVFFVASVAKVRSVVDAHGGVMEPADKEWSFNGVRVCDGVDPEGNVIQFREIGG